MSTLDLPKELEEWVRAEVAAGRASSAEVLARTALEAHRRRVEAFRASLQEAIEEADREGWIDGEEMLTEMDEMIAALEKEADEAERG